ncbi:MAG: phospholipase [Methanomicrobiales archaeon]|nr:phospholipase [Methanomicrobiales archaeon]
MRLLAALLLIACAAAPASGILITEFCPDTWQKGEQDEYLVITGEGSLDAVRIGDGEGSIAFPAGSRIAGSATIARYATAYRTTHGILPDWEMYDTDPEVPDIRRTGDLRMGNEGDELYLTAGNALVQSVAWPGDVHPREGQVHVLEGGAWDLRPYFIGQSRFAPQTFTGVALTAFVAPDCAGSVMASTLAGADEYVLVSVYEMTSPDITGWLSAAACSGVDVSIILEGGPVGGIPAGEGSAAAQLSESGAMVLQMGTTEAAHARYRYTHAKYAVVDGDAVLLTSENFKPSGFPETGKSGNRGWGVVIEDAAVAGYFEQVWQHDVAGGDISPAHSSGPPAEEAAAAPYDPEFLPATFTGATVTPVLSPDSSHLIIGLIDSATRTLDIEQAYITPWPASGENPYLEAAIDAARRGVAVRIMLDGSWFNTEAENDNDERVREINALAAREGIPLQARTAALASLGLEKIHTKGVIADGERVLVSSINWNENSPCFNREAGVIIDHPGAGAYFAAVFESDWEGSPPQTAGEGVPLDKRLCAVGILALLAVLGYRRHRR